MANRHTLAIHKLDEFKEWLDLVGVEHRSTTADWQVLQVRLQGDPRWHAIYQKMAAKEHLSVPEPLARLVRAFVNQGDPYEGLSPAQRQKEKALTLAFRYGSPSGRLVKPYQPPFHNLPIQTQAAKQLLISMNRCCEKAVPLGTATCPECEEASAGYQGSMSSNDTPPWE